MASDTEVLRHRDVASMSAAEKHRLAALFATLRPRPRCGVPPGTSAGTAAPSTRSRTLRASLRRMGEPADIEWRRRGNKPRRVVLLVDVSGSMSGYADALLRLAHRITQARAGVVETFTVGTRLTHVTRALRGRDAERALVAAGETVPDWSGGTRLGETLKIFMDRWGQRGLARGAVVVVFSDGWERGDPALLAEQMARLQPGRAPRGVGQPAPRASTATSRCSRASWPCCPTSTTSWPATRWRRTRSCWRWSPVRDVLPELMNWWEAGDTIGVGTVVATFQSAPRPPGASMLVGPDETAVGSVSGGCVEGAVYDLAQSVVESGTPVLQRYGVSDDDAFAVGLTCGGILDVYVERVSQETFPELGEIAADIEAGRPVALATVIEHPDPAWLGRRLVVRPGGIVQTFRTGQRSRVPTSGLSDARLAARRRRGPGRRDGAAGGRAQRDADLRPRRRAPRRGDAGLRVGVRAQAAAAGVRRDRLRGRGGAGRLVPRLPRHRVRRPARVRDDQPVPGGRRGGRRLAAPLPDGRARGRPDRPADRASPC